MKELTHRKRKKFHSFKQIRVVKVYESREVRLSGKRISIEEGGVGDSS